MFPGSGIQDVVWDQLQNRRASNGLGALKGDFLFFRADIYLNSNTNYLFGSYRAGSITATTTPRYLILPTDGILSNLYLRAGQVGVGTGSAIFDVEVEAVDSGITCTVPIADNPNIGEDSVHTFQANAGDSVRISVRRSGSGTFTSAPERVRATLLFTPL